MKILLVTEFFPVSKQLKFSGGVEARTYYLAKHLSKKHEVIVICSQIKGTKKEEVMDGFTVIRVGPEREYIAKAGDIFNRVRYMFNAIKKGKELDIEIVDGGNFIAHFIAKEIARIKKIPVVAWYPDVWVNSWIKNAGLVGIVGEILERINLLRGFSRYIAISKETARKLSKYIDLNQIDVVYCGVDLEEFKSKKKKNRFKTIICVARLVNYKNQQILLYALKEILNKRRCNLILVGSGPDKDYLINLAKKLGIANHLTIYSDLSRAKLIKIIQSADIFCLPSKVEGFGIATIEAAAAGLPYVNSNIDVQREVTKNGLGGFLVDPHNFMEFAEGIDQLFTDKSLYKQKSEQARLLAESYEWSRIAEQTEGVYKKLIK